MEFSEGRILGDGIFESGTFGDGIFGSHKNLIWNFLKTFSKYWQVDSLSKF